jgi:hypothetical protein
MFEIIGRIAEIKRYPLGVVYNVLRFGGLFFDKKVYIN